MKKSLGIFSKNKTNTQLLQFLLHKAFFEYKLNTTFITQNFNIQNNISRVKRNKSFEFYTWFIARKNFPQET